MKANKFGIKVGDLFYSSWGYDQTNVDFFQVVALSGESSVRLRPVVPPVLEDDPTGPMASYVTYKTDELPILPSTGASVFIKDTERGDLKRVQRSGYDGSLYVKISSFANAYKCTGETKRLYESWYA